MKTSKRKTVADHPPTLTQPPAQITLFFNSFLYCVSGFVMVFVCFLFVSPYPVSFYHYHFMFIISEAINKTINGANLIKLLIIFPLANSLIICFLPLCKKILSHILTV